MYLLSYGYGSLRRMLVDDTRRQACRRLASLIACYGSNSSSSTSSCLTCYLRLSRICSPRESTTTWFSPSGLSKAPFRDMSLEQTWAGRMSPWIRARCGAHCIDCALRTTSHYQSASRLFVGLLGCWIVLVKCLTSPPKLPIQRPSRIGGVRDVLDKTS